MVIKASSYKKKVVKCSKNYLYASSKSIFNYFVKKDSTLGPLFLWFLNYFWTNFVYSAYSGRVPLSSRLRMQK